MVLSERVDDGERGENPSGMAGSTGPGQAGMHLRAAESPPYDEFLSVAVEEWQRIQKFQQDAIILMLDICKKMHDLRKFISREYGGEALFEDKYGIETACSHLAKASSSILRAMRCIENAS